MAITVRRVDPAATFMLALAHNLLCATSTNVGSLFHGDRTSTTTTDQWLTGSTTALTVTAANATDLPSCITLVNNIRSVCVVHFADGISTDPYSAGAHKIPDTVDAPLLGLLVTATGNTSTDTAAVVAAANLHKSTINSHLTQASPSAVHFTNDGTNTIATTNASDLPSSITLLNAIKSALNAHMGSAPTNPMLRIVNA